MKRLDKFTADNIEWTDTPSVKEREQHSRLKLGLRLKDDMSVGDLSSGGGKLGASCYPKRKYKRVKP